METKSKKVRCSDGRIDGYFVLFVNAKPVGVILAGWHDENEVGNMCDMYADCAWILKPTAAVACYVLRDDGKRRKEYIRAQSTRYCFGIPSEVEEVEGVQFMESLSRACDSM